MFLVPLVVFLGVKFGFQKSCLCKRNDKYEVCYYSLQFCQDFMDYLIFFAGFAFSLSALLAPNGALSPSSDGFK